MLIINSTKLNLYLLICLSCLVLTQLGIKLFLLPKYSKKEAVKTQMFFLELPANCYFSNNDYFFKIENCQSLKTNNYDNIGYFLTVIGRVESDSANRFFEQKKIDVESFELTQPTPLSVKSWLMKLQGLFFRLKNYLKQRLIQILPFQYTVLLLQMLFGGEYGEVKLLDHFFKITGMQHVAAVSGFNVSLIGSLIFTLNRRFRGFKRFLIWWVGVSLYILLTDLSAAVLRAYLMAIINVGTVQLSGKNYHNLYGLAVASLLMLAIDPFYLTNVSFQLSVLATLGITLFGPFLKLVAPVGLSQMSGGEVTTGLAHLSQIKEVLTESFWTTIMAQSLALPVILFHFGELSLVSLVANTFLLWLTPIITIYGVFLSGFILILPLSIGKILTWPLEVLLTFFVGGLSYFAQFDQFYFSEIEFSLPLVATWWVVVCLIWFYLKKKDAQTKNNSGFALSLAHLGSTPV